MNPPISLRTIALSSDTDWRGFRHAAQELLQDQVDPGHVMWFTTASASGDLFSQDLFSSPPAVREVDQKIDASVIEKIVQAPLLEHDLQDSSNHADSLPINNSASSYKIPAALDSLLQTLQLHREPSRFALMYRLVWRWQHDAVLRGDALDTDRALARTMAQSVRRDIHKMQAFVRFRPVINAEGETVHMAWFEPDHFITAANASFFVRRFAQMHWVILTPDCSIEWDKKQLHIGPGAKRSQAAQADAGEALWLTYYRSTFNPARLKLNMMRKEMPQRYWRNLPEAALITELAQTAHARSGQMVEAPATTPKRMIPPMQISRPQALSRPQTIIIDAGTPPAQALLQLHLAAQSCQHCPLGALATQVVWGQGPAHPSAASLMVVDEQPDDAADLRGQRSHGAADVWLDRALSDLGITRSALYFTHAVKHFKFSTEQRKRSAQRPDAAEIEACGHWLDQEIRWQQPKAMLALGAVAAYSLLGHKVVMEDARGQWHTGRHGLPVLVAWHPSALLRLPQDQQENAYLRWLQDLRQMLAHIQEG